jgi:hypothetical protein
MKVVRVGSDMDVGDINVAGIRFEEQSSIYVSLLYIFKSVCSHSNTLEPAEHQWAKKRRFRIKAYYIKYVGFTISTARPTKTKNENKILNLLRTIRWWQYICG